jgi:UDP-N-acetylglucosamine enolpyruvyl transferase
MDVIIVHGGDKVGVRQIKLEREGWEQAKASVQRKKRKAGHHKAIHGRNPQPPVLSLVV